MTFVFTRFLLFVLFAGATTGNTLFVLMHNSPARDFSQIKSRMTCMMFSTDPIVQQEYDTQQRDGQAVFEIDVDHVELLNKDFSSYKVIGFANWDDATEEDDEVFDNVRLANSVTVTYGEREFTVNGAIAVIEVERDMQYRPKSIEVDSEQNGVYILFDRYTKQEVEGTYNTLPLLKTTTRPLQITARCHQQISTAEMISHGLDNYVETNDPINESYIEKKYGLTSIAKCGDPAVGIFAIPGKLPLPVVQTWDLALATPGGFFRSLRLGPRKSGADFTIFLKYNDITLQRRTIQLDKLEHDKTVADFDSPCQVTDAKMISSVSLGDDDRVLTVIDLEVMCDRERRPLVQGKPTRQLPESTQTKVNI